MNSRKNPEHKKNEDNLLHGQLKMRISSEGVGILDCADHCLTSSVEFIARFDIE